MIKYIVIDDETNPRELLIYTIENLNLPFKLIGQANNLLDGIDLIKKLKPQVVFLDIQMPIHNGLKIREFLQPDNANFKLVFVTAYSQYTIQAIRLAAFDYLQKPIEENDLNECLKRIIKQENNNNNIYNQLKSIENNNIIVINSHNGNHFINIKDIHFIVADGMYSKFKLKNKNIIASKPLKYYEDLHQKLIRIHRSYIINIDFIEKIKGLFIILKNKEKVPVSRNKKTALIQILKINA
ncbi:MAG TPA: response regulator [Flavobacteriia bacterium]|nr:response regulator [Flavobacteriia bacterium]